MLAPWDVVAVDFPYIESSETRRRPALVIASAAVDARFSVIWVSMITSAAHSRWPGDVLLTDLAVAGLTRACCVRTEKIATIDSRLAEPIGHLATTDRQAVADRLRGMLSHLLAS